jgi:hypothetical protein
MSTFRWETSVYFRSEKITYHRWFDRIWTEVFELGATSSSTTSQIINDLTIPTMFNILHRALEDRKKMVTVCTHLPLPFLVLTCRPSSFPNGQWIGWMTGE